MGTRVPGAWDTGEEGPRPAIQGLVKSYVSVAACEDVGRLDGNQVPGSTCMEWSVAERRKTAEQNRKVGNGWVR